MPPVPIRSTRYHSIDIWRAIACLGVVIHHAATYGEFVPTAHELTVITVTSTADAVVQKLTYLGHGVTIFFVISGYCIMGAVESTLQSGRSFGQYCWRRFRRIFPPYWAALAMLGAFQVALAAIGLDALMTHSMGSGTGIPPLSSLSPIQWLGNLTLTEGYRGLAPYLWRGGPEKWLLGPAWTLGYEEQFYAVSGLLMLTFRRRVFLGALLVSVGVLFFLGHPYVAVGTFLNGRWLLFAFGIAVYYAIRYWRHVWPMSVALIVAGVVGQWSPVLQEEFAVAAAFSVLLLTCHRFDHYVPSTKWLRPLAAVGLMSYSLYLVHWPIVKVTSHVLYRLGVDSSLGVLLVSVPIGIAASLLVAWPFHRFIERPCLNAPVSVRSSPQSTGGVQTTRHAG